MKSSRHVATLRPGADPLEERPRKLVRFRVTVLGCVFTFVANDTRLLRLVKHAYAGLPVHALAKRSPQCNVEVRLASDADSKTLANRAPNIPNLRSGAGFLCGLIDANNFALAAPQLRSGLVSVSRAMLRFPYHLRYELIEFVVYLLSARVQQLVSMHAACVGRNRRGVVVIGASGAGKSTLALHCMRAGMDFLAEDSVSVRPDNLLATGVANFLHLRIGADYFLNGAPRWITKSPVIERRSGIKKFEIDLRRTDFKLAAAPLKIAAVVFLSSKKLRHQPLLAPLNKTESIERLQRSQPYAATQPGWDTFIAGISRLNSYVLHRAKHPSGQVAAIESLLR